MKTYYFYIAAKATLKLTEKMRELRKAIGLPMTELLGDSLDEHFIYTDTFYQTTGSTLTAREIIAIKEGLKKNLHFPKEHYYLKDLQIILITPLDEKNVIQVKTGQVRNFYYVATLRRIKKIETISSVENTSFSGFLTITKNTPFQKLLNEVKQGQSEENTSGTDGKLVFKAFYELAANDAGMENKN